MKDFVRILNQISNRKYSATDKDVNETLNRLKRIDLEKIDSNYAECEGLNAKFEEIDFNDRKDAIINRLFERRRKGQVARQPKCLFLWLMLGFFALGAGCFVLLAKPYDFFFKQKILLQDGGEIFEMWRKPEVELYARIYLFNITNAEEYMSGKENKIKLKEVGPYVYREYLEHKITKFNDNGTLSVIPEHPLTWVEELSEGHKEDDVLFLPHIALLSIANVVSKQSLLTRFGLNRLITFTNSQPLAKMTAKEFMMGYKSQLMTLGNTFLPGWISFDKLGLIDRMYDFNGDYETIFTGATDIRYSGLIDTYRGSTDLPQWEGKHCSNVQYASDGTKFRGRVGMNDTLLFYRRSLCRAAPLIPTEEGVKSGIMAYKYTFPEHMLDNGKYLEENKCFCRKGHCLPDGVLDVTDCYYGFPIALSYPHFYQGEDILFSKVEGLSPNKEKHETRFWIQPDTGLPLDVSSKFQINMALGDISMIQNTERFSNMFLPLLWFDIRMYTLPPNLEQRFQLYINILPIVEQVAMYTLFIAGSVLILLTVYTLTFKVMFKTLDKKFGTEMWCNKEKKHGDSNIYAPCEIPLNDCDNIVKAPIKINIGSVKNIFDRKTSVDEQNDTKGYLVVNQNDEVNDDDCKYLEIIDDGSEFDLRTDCEKSDYRDV
ncbi:hypothetical protein K1T71_000939 [Dendrolimus kikuchii]|uniref:Uncharacterized protein n=1 Tax=Dendrolimus kikuchii TaxID=765133 RepID=A0ACC1DG86_9NEOP|nr:hypothetical protein K1T71_000939 [Dendrolimus kikuchii]